MVLTWCTHEVKRNAPDVCWNASWWIYGEYNILSCRLLVIRILKISSIRGEISSAVGLTLRKRSTVATKYCSVIKERYFRQEALHIIYSRFWGMTKLIMNNNFFFCRRRSTLVIPKVRPEDEGVYRCEAKSVIGVDANMTARVTVVSDTRPENSKSILDLFYWEYSAQIKMPFNCLRHYALTEADAQMMYLER
jgi:hypothetical protein